MAKLIMTVGMSGSGKTYLRKQLENYYKNKIEIICPDEIRKDVLGDINNQSEGNRIFEIAKHMTKGALANSKNDIVLFDSTNLNYSRLKKACQEYLIDENDPKLVIFMMDSENYELCESRVKKDIENNVDRSNVPEDVLKSQYERFEQCLTNCICNDDYFAEGEIFLYKNNFNELVKMNN